MPNRIIELWVAQARIILRRIAPLMFIIRGTVGSDPDLAAQWHTNEQQRCTAMRMLAGLLAERHALRPGLGVEDAAELTFLINSVEGYFLATRTLGWPPERWERTTASLLTAALLEPTAAGRPVAG